MAVTDDCPLYPSDTLVLKKGRKHYRTPVRAQHWQLRSLVSAEKKHIVYFPGGTSSRCLQRLNTRTHECETLVKLQFAPRCLTADHGWLCCGSEHGDFVAVKLEIDDDDEDQYPLELDPDARLQLGLDEASEAVENLMSRASRPVDRHLPARTAKMAKDRVNCITLWAPSHRVPTAPGAYTSPVAILANNDRTVTLVDLEDFDDNEQPESIDRITYPDFVNRAIISPDGRFLVAILDDPYLYIHERTSVPGPARRDGPAYEWQLARRLMLKSQKKHDSTDSRGSFAACFSNSGLYLAVGTQHGTISIFDATLLTDDMADPLITTFQSSQPKSGPGAVRDMAFCPGPYDLLAWTEDRRHIGIADMRSDFVVRQILDISEENTFEHINPSERNTIDPRLLDRRDNDRIGSVGNNSRRRIERLEALNRALTTDEMMVLEAMRGDRRRRERMALLMGTDASQIPSSTGRTAAQDGGGSARTGDQSTEARSPGSFLDTSRETQEQARTRRYVMRNGQVPADSFLFARRREPRWTEGLADEVAAIRQNARDTAARHDVSDHANRTVIEILHAQDRAMRQAAPAENASNTAEFTSYINPSVIGSRWEESALRNTLPDHGVFDVPPSPDNTAGISWSEDGRTLFVGAQNGIYEFHIDVQDRKYRSGSNWR